MFISWWCVWCGEGMLQELIKTFVGFFWRKKPKKSAFLPLWTPSLTWKFWFESLNFDFRSNGITAAASLEYFRASIGSQNQGQADINTKRPDVTSYGLRDCDWGFTEILMAKKDEDHVSRMALVSLNRAKRRYDSPPFAPPLHTTKLPLFVFCKRHRNIIPRQ